jgi:hypothetical protein
MDGWMDWMDWMVGLMDGSREREIEIESEIER